MDIYLPFLYIQAILTVSVGNLPPHTSAIIKITYVAEVEVQGEAIVFSLPTSLAPWQKQSALNMRTQVT